MNVLSLFDGISCGQIALQKAGIVVTNYFASEIDPYALKVTQANYPQTIQLGDVLELNLQDLPEIDLLIGGSPCQGFSFAGKQLNFKDSRSKLFFEFVRILDILKPTYFLLENVPMKQQYQNIISECLKVQPLQINSRLVSAQNRNRLYWTNISSIVPISDHNIKIQDILETPGVVASQRGRFLVNGKRQDGKMKTAGLTKQYIEFRHDNKSNALTTVRKDNVVVEHTLRERILASDIPHRYLTPLECERLQTIPDNYTQGLSDTQRCKLLGNAWTVDILTHIFKHMRKR